MANSIVDDYLFSLADLKENSKLLINLLTTLAKENIGSAKDVADAIIKHMNAVSPSLKLPCLYLIDSIIKNIGEPYISVFSENITIIFDSVFQKVDEATRAQMYKLRLTWNTVFPSKTLRALDIRIKQVDPAWPIATKPFSQNVHINPKFLKTANSADVILPATASKIACTTSCVQPMLTTGDSRSTASMSSKSATLPNQLMFCGPNNQNLSNKNTVGPVENQSVPSLDLSLVHKQQDPRQKNLRQRDPRRAALQNYLMQQRRVTALSTLKAPSVLISKTSHSMPSVDSVIKVQPVVSEATVFPLVKEMVLETIRKIEKQHEETAVIGKNAVANFKSDKKIPSKAELPGILSEGKISCGRKKTEKGELNQAVSKLSTYSTKAAEEQKEVCPNKKRPPFHVLQNQKRPVCQYPRLPPQKINKKIFTSPRSDCDLRLNKRNVEHGMVIVESSGKYGNSNADVDLRSHPKHKDNKYITGEVWDINGTDELYEPPEKKVKGNEQNADVEDSLFGSEDRDYRCKQLEEHLEKLNSKDSTAYKKAHLDELKPYPLHHSGENVKTNHSTYKGYENLNGKAPIMPQRDTCSFNPVECEMLLRQSQQRMEGDGFKHLDSIQGCIRRNHSFSPSHESSLNHLHDSLNDSKRILEQACEINKLRSPNQGDFTDVQHVFESISRPHAQLKMKEYGRDMPLHRDDLPDVAFPKQITSKLGNMPRGICTDYHHLSPKQMTNIQGPNIPVPTVRTIDLDGKPTAINFVDDKAFVLLGNNEPRQLMFVGNPVNVFIADLKLLLRFDGKPVQFELDDAVHSVKLGTPSRELYINDYPYEVKFGGPPITATLRNARVYDISLGGPPPHVEVSRQPVYELYQKYLDQNHRDPNLNPSVMARNDTDMRQIDQNNNVQNEQKLDVGQSFLKLELHSYFPLPSGFGGGKLSNRLDNTYIACHQEPQKLKLDGHPPPKVVNPITPQHSERRHPYQGTQMTNSSHNTAPRGMPSHLRNWNQPMPPPSYTSEQNLEPVNHPWMSKNVTPAISESAQTSKLKTMFDGPREYAVRHFGEQGNLRNDSESLGQPNFKPSFKPALNFHTARPEFSPSFATRPALFPPPIHPVSLPSCSQSFSLERARHPVPPSVPQSSMHVNAFAPIKQEVPSIPVLPSTLPSESSCLPPLASFDDFQLNAVPIKPSTSSIVPPSPDLDVASLFSKLLGAGIIVRSNSKEPDVKVKVESFKKEKIKEENQESDKRKNQESDKKKNQESDKKENKKPHKKENKSRIPPIKLELESLKIKQPAVIDFLHQGTECVSCGMRFKEVDNVKYSRHLDWHFRMNRRGKNAISKAHSRMWYYEAELWAKFEEFEDPEECAQNFFELQANEHRQPKPVIDVPSVPISSQENESCAVCREPFQLFWMEDEEEWHLRNAVRHDDEAYHPLCHEDYLKAARERETQIEKSLVTDIAETTPMDVDMRADLYAENVKKEPLDEADCIQMGEETSWLMNTPEETIVTKKEENRKMEISLKEELMQGKPGEEEVIGLISQSEAQITPNEKSERVVLGTGSIVMRVKPESLKLSSSSTESASEKEISEDGESEEKIQLPTPDPRFQVLSPVQRGTEISSLCCIM